MASNKPPPNQKKAGGGGGGGWGSMFTSAITGLESRLDTILADEPDASARQKIVEREKERSRARAGSGARSVSRNPSRTREGSRTRQGEGEGKRSGMPVSGGENKRSGTPVGGGDRLKERLARATAAKSGGAGGVGSRNSSVGPRGSSDVARGAGEEKGNEAGEKEEAEGKEAREDEREQKEQSKSEETEASGNTAPSTLLSSGLPINPAQEQSAESSTRHSLDVPSRDEATSCSNPSSELQIGTPLSGESASQLEAEMEHLRASHAQAEKQRREEMHANLERIDALQAKLQYLAKETVAAAKEANASATSGSADAKLAKKDEQIALLMEEGEKLSKTELRQNQTIRKLRAKAAEDEKGRGELSRRADGAEKAETELKGKVRRAEAAERQAAEKVKQIGAIEAQVDELRDEREKAVERIKALTAQVKEAEKRAQRAEKEAGEKVAQLDKGRIAELENELEDAKVERKLTEDKTKGEVRKVREEAERTKERAAMREQELKNEIAGLDSRLEALRARVEEASSEGGVGGDGSVKLLRQVETLQSQYGLAKENWETIENSLNARLAAVEKERDEAGRREAEVRRKARDAAARTRSAEDEVERVGEKLSTLTADLSSRDEQTRALQHEFEAAQAALSDAKADLDRQKRVFETELSSRLEEEKSRWQQRHHPNPTLRTIDSPARKTSAAAPRTTTRLASPRLASPSDRPTSSRRHSNHPSAWTPPTQDLSPSLSRHESTLSFDPHAHPTPSIEIEREPSDTTSIDADSGHRTLNDLVSSSTPAAGPSVQLVSRMSAAVRRLETEKSAHSDEITRLSAQRDAARDEVVALMRELEGKKEEGGRLEELEREVKVVKGRYEACLGLLGEREEEVEGLREDLAEVKRMYRVLVEEKVGA